MRYISWFEDSDGDVSALGGKGASLVTLHRAGFQVPPGFCVLAAGYRRFVQVNGLQPLLERLAETPDLRLPKVAREACAPLTARLGEAALPDDLTEAIETAYRDLLARCSGDPVVAVRSSALSEDASAASSAGVYETYLNLRDAAAVLDAVLRCYRSLWAPRAVQYRAFRGVNSAHEAMAVVIMQMIEAEVSGVAFTVNPVTGDRAQITVNASWGLGETIVSGRVTPDQFLVDKSSLRVLHQEIAAKEVAVLPHPGGDSGTVEVPVPQTRALAPALSEGQLRELAQTCLRIEAHYGRPVDVEWAFAGGRLYVLQARPVTGLA